MTTATAPNTQARPAYTIGETRYYGVVEAAKYLGLTQDAFKWHLARNPTGLPFYIVPANGRKAFSQETLDTYRDQWMTPQPQPA